MDKATETTAASGLETDWSREAILDRRDRYFAATQRAFVPYETPLVIRQGKGQYVWDEDGNRLIDLLGMNLCISVGHAHPAVTAAVKDQVDRLTHCTTMFHHPVPAHFAEELAATMPAGEDWVVHFTNSGTEAIDLAIMLARSATGNSDMLALRNSYHGATYGAQGVTGVRNFRHNIGQLSNISFVAEPNQYRGIFGAGTEPYLEEIDRTIAYTTSGALAGMIIEPVQGYGGIVVMPDGYLKGAFERVRAAGGLCIVDEVQSGFGKTGEAMWGFERHGVVPDIVVMAKGIGNGIPLGAVVMKRHVAEAMREKFLFHTYGANPVACAAGRAVLQVIRDENLIENARTVGAALMEHLESLKQRYQVIGDVRGRGFMMAIELVKDRQTREPAPEATAKVFERTRDNGLIMSKSGNFKNILRMVPPLCLSMDDVEPVAEALDRSFSGVSPE
ncbi:alanine-glyoxylate transaminase/(R)-3-amino-2-methylpropionate-pyruvate transaminase [Rhodobium orientis]|uniref:alanine--glyoxylate transaminase n=1 Tax=Rhodobium orientis TaxID=34017 RepID=A0A327JH72_9HYPH|nr:aspartate aminotransferase family protein [Rhodobium orientis]MBB4301887.1 alanine-glyoxylate transaminase/(R)-3-amino-2-methylpropionate-pyruvate transaminase [Rhodobium orientis]MBK5950125.1 aspartate aminotransferase family protein [Rhodobium orientis]RAI25679.1 aspartate aminotransferase family protein [Rhodobium orientis]